MQPLRHAAVVLPRLHWGCKPAGATETAAGFLVTETAASFRATDTAAGLPEAAKSLLGVWLASVALATVPWDGALIQASALLLSFITWS